MRPMKYRKQKVPVFVGKLYRILNDVRSQSIIEWTPERDAFVILDLNQFTQTILPLYFKHSNYSSFIRQLNMYNFAKKRQDGIVGEEEHIYFNQNFLGHDEKKMKEIRRKEIGQGKCLMLKSKPQLREDDLQQIDDLNEGKGQPLIEKLQWKIKTIKSQQEHLKEMAYHLIRQNQHIITQNKQLSLKYKREARKKDRVLDQVFRIVGASIAEFWNDLCGDSQTIEGKAQNLQELYHLLVQFINQNDMSFILKTLDLFLMKNDQKKVRIFNIVTQNEESLFRVQEDQVNEFISATSIIETQKK